MAVDGMPQHSAPEHAHPCPTCGHEWGTGLACQFCKQVEGLPAGVQIATAGRRLGGFLLEWLLIIITLWIGWAIWSVFFSWKKGQTPAKQVMGMRCVKLSADWTASWRTMGLREVIAKPVIGLLSWVTFGIVNFWLVWDDKTQELWDKMAGTIVVNDPAHALDPGMPKQSSWDSVANEGAAHVPPASHKP